MEKFDKSDLIILSHLAEDARLTIKDLAIRSGISRSTINQRIGRLLSSSALLNRGLYIDPKVLGYNTCSYVGISLDKAARYKEIINHLKEIPQVVECHSTTGEHPILIKVYGKDNADLMHTLHRINQNIPGVVATQTMISLEIGFERLISQPAILDALKRELPDEPEREDNAESIEETEEQTNSNEPGDQEL